MRSGRFDPREDERMVNDALEHAVAMGVPRTAIDRLLHETMTQEPDDDFRAPILAGKLHALARAHDPPRAPDVPQTAENAVAQPGDGPSPEQPQTQ